MMKKITAIATALALSITFVPRPVKANPAMLLVPELCATGIGCVVGAVVLIGGVAYIVQQQNGHKVLIPKDTGVTYSRPLSAEEARSQGNSHWIASNDPTLCYKMANKYGWRVKAHPPAQGGGRWCIFHGEQTSFDGDKD